MTWFAIRAKPNREILACNDLFVSEGYDTFCLHYRVIVRHANRVTPKLRPHYTGYFFADLDDDGIHVAMRTRGVIDLVRRGKRPAPPLEIPLSVIAKERARSIDGMGLMETPAPEQRPLLANGSRWRVLDGTFAGFAATVKLDKGSAIAVWVNLLGRELEVELAPQALIA